MKVEREFRPELAKVLQRVPEEWLMDLFETHGAFEEEKSIMEEDPFQAILDFKPIPVKQDMTALIREEREKLDSRIRK